MALNQTTLELEGLNESDTHMEFLYEITFLQKQLRTKTKWVLNTFYPSKKFFTQKFCCHGNRLKKCFLL